MTDERNGNEHDRNEREKDYGKACPMHQGERCYEIRVKGHLSGEWSEWLEGMELRLVEDGETVLAGKIEDQSALMGILNKLNRLNLTLVSIKQVKGE